MNKDKIQRLQVGSVSNFLGMSMLADTTMCVNDNCPLRSKCCRHEASGTIPMSYQSYALFQPKDDSCEYGVLIKE